MKIFPPQFSYSGWELPPNCLLKIQEIIVSKNITKLDVLEFGSGKSTDTILDFIKINNLAGVYDCFDAHSEYAHPKAILKEIYSPYTKESVNEKGLIYEYVFYRLDDSDFNSNDYNLVISDGHHGPGRMECWKYTKNRTAADCVVVIDDYDHYPFVEEFMKYYPNAIKLASHWELNNRWVIFQV